MKIIESVKWCQWGRFFLTTLKLLLKCMPKVVKKNRPHWHKNKKIPIYLSYLLNKRGKVNYYLVSVIFLQLLP